ncbi:hypothetical protein [Delftia lacustris]
MFKDFDFSLLNDPDFKEDSVREELIVPLLRKLGYSSSGVAKIIRSKNLSHPFVAIGSQPRKINIVPDYVFSVNGKHLWILDAKSPNEEITKSIHVEQAYSYAIHPEIRAEMYALCNGREFVLYDTRKYDPILRFKMEEVNDVWEKLFRILNADIQGNPELVNYEPDFGVYLRRIGGDKNMRFIAPFCRTNYVGKMEDGKYTTFTSIDGDVSMGMSLDFNEEMLNKLLSFQSEEIAGSVREALRRQPFYYHCDDSENDLFFGVIANLSDKVVNNNEESYIPFLVSDFKVFGTFKNGVD